MNTPKYGPSTFLVGEFAHLRRLAHRLAHQTDSVSGYIWHILSEKAQGGLVNYESSASEPESLEMILVRDFNIIISGPLIYDAERFKGIDLRPETQELLRASPEGPSLQRLNRLLMEDAYPLELSRKIRHSLVEEIFESTLYNCRFFVLIAVLGSIVASFILFLKGSIEVSQGTIGFLRLMHQFTPTSADDKTVILAFIPAIDDYLFAMVLLIFSMGIYELFISEIDPSWKGPATRPNWLAIKNLDDLKTHISEVIVMILIINFFNLSFSAPLAQPMDLLLLGAGIALVAGAIFITHQIMHKRKISKQHDRAQSLSELGGKQSRPAC